MSDEKYNVRWTREETIVALNLYCKIPFKDSRASHPLVIEYANLIGRSPAAMNLKIGNLGRLDPMLQAKGITGLTNGSKLDVIVWNEFFWYVGQSVYTYVYGHMGTNELAGMSLTGAVQGLTMGALSGLSQAAGILIGKRLGSREYDAAYEDSKKLCCLGVAGSLVFTLLLILIRNPYVQLFNVSGDVRRIGADIMAAFAILMPVKVQNMILGGGIIRSGGKTKYVMMIDMMGTWLIGVPLALLTGLYFKIPVIWVYFVLSQEELVRLIVSVFMFRSRKWMHTLQ